MKPIEQLRRYIKATHPDAALTLTSPLDKEGAWHLDVICGDRRLAIEWSFATGFGVSSLTDESYGERPDEAFKSLEDVQRRVTRLLATDEHTAPPIGVLLSRLREERGYTQEELALNLGVRQATVSGMERRDDVQFSTLRRVIKALSGSLEIFAVFSDRRYRLGLDSIDSSPYKPALLPIYEQMSECKYARTATPRIDYEVTFEALHESGDLMWAKKVADRISSRGTVFEMVD